MTSGADPVTGCISRTATQGLRALLLFGLSLVLVACERPVDIGRVSGPTMGTVWSVQVGERPADLSLPALQEDIEALLLRVNQQMSTYIADSDLSRFNQAPPGTWQQIPEEFSEVLAASLTMAETSQGAFDPTVGPLVNLWGFGPEGRRSQAPDAGAVAAARERVGWERIDVRESGREIRQPGELYLDFSAIAKGYAVDLIGEYLDARGVEGWLVDIGGDMRARGLKPDGEPWRIGIERPVNGQRQVHSVVQPGDLAMATSGDYRNYFRDGDRQFSHTIDPRTAEPVDHGLVSVTVLHPSCMFADGYATLLTVLGPDEGLAFAQREGLAVLLISRDGEAFREAMTEGFRERLAQ